MRPIHFQQQTTLLGRDQTEVVALPAFRGEIPFKPTGYGTEEVISCYRLTDDDLKTICTTRVIWLRQIVAKGGPLQPQLLQLENPFEFSDGTIWDGKGTEPENWTRK